MNRTKQFKFTGGVREYACFFISGENDESIVLVSYETVVFIRILIDAVAMGIVILRELGTSE